MLLSAVIAEDHDVTRQGLQRILEDRLEVRIVAATGSGAEVVPLVDEHGPDLLILDLGLPDVNGLTILDRLYRRDNPVTVVVLSMQDEDVYVSEALQKGAGAYVLKGSPIQELIDAIRSAMNGDVFLSEALPTAHLETKPDTEPPPDRYSTLTEREREVLELIAHGRSSDAIGEKLQISPRTVDKHRQNLKAKLELRNSVELTRFFLESNGRRIDSTPPTD